MNKKLITSILTAGFLFSFVLATSASAFWPFDALFKKDGEVKAETTEKRMPTDMYIAPGGGNKAYMTYQTLTNMNDACRRMFSLDFPTPTKAKITPSAREGKITNTMKLQEDAAETSMRYVQDYGIDSKSERELTSIYNNLKARCENIANLVSRMQKIYKGQAKPTVMPTKEISITSSPRMKCDLNSKEKNYGCPANMTCNGGYCQPVREVTLSPVETSGDNSRDITCGGIAGKTCPTGYICMTPRTAAKTNDAMGTCVKSEVKNFNIKE